MSNSIYYVCLFATDSFNSTGGICIARAVLNWENDYTQDPTCEYHLNPHQCPLSYYSLTSRYQGSVFQTGTFAPGKSALVLSPPALLRCVPVTSICKTTSSPAFPPNPAPGGFLPNPKQLFRPPCLARRPPNPSSRSARTARPLRKAISSRCRTLRSERLHGLMWKRIRIRRAITGLIYRR